MWLAALCRVLQRRPELVVFCRTEEIAAVIRAAPNGAGWAAAIFADRADVDALALLAEVVAALEKVSRAAADRTSVAFQQWEHQAGTAVARLADAAVVRTGNRSAVELMLNECGMVFAVQEEQEALHNELAFTE